MEKTKNTKKTTQTHSTGQRIQIVSLKPPPLGYEFNPLNRKDDASHVWQDKHHRTVSISNETETLTQLVYLL